MRERTQKRPTRAQKRDANRARILAAARTVFGARGYHEATIEEIAEESGLSNGAVYYNFNNKEDLFLALLEERVDERIEHIRSALIDPRSGDADPAGFQQEAHHALAVIKQSRDWRLLLLEFVTYGARHPEFRARFVAHRNKGRDALAAALAQRTETRAGTPPIPPHELALLILALIDGLAIEEVLEPNSVPDDLAGRAVQALLDAPG